MLKIDLAFKGGEVVKSPKGRFSQRVTLKFFDSRQIDIELSDNRDVGFFANTRGKFRRTFASLEGFDGVLQFSPIGKATIEISERDYISECGQVFIFPLRFEPALHRPGGEYDGRPFPPSDSQAFHVLDPDSHDDTGVVGKLPLDSTSNELEPGVYLCEIRFTVKRNKYGSPLPSIQIVGVGDQVSGFFSEPQLVMSDHQSQAVNG